uniref:Uncharacterized protein n=1 Tax=viral metagenome TaxID=1070528 RepID=A0A6C0KN95_9ZZZZ
MEKNIRLKVNEHMEEMITSMQTWIEKNNAQISVNDVNKTNEFIQFMRDFPNIELHKEDFQKRKRLKNNVPDFNRCIALKCNGDRCSRRQKTSGVMFCGTHMKGAHYGTTDQVQSNKQTETIQLWLQDINGISRYIDKNNNIYCMEDILNSVETPRIIGQYGIRENNTYFMIQT